MKRYDKDYEAIRLQLDDSGLICNSNFEVLPSSEIIAVKDITSGQFVDYYIINYYKASTDLDLELMMLLFQRTVRINCVLTSV